ncbi:MAG: hypothetical protein ACYCWW_12720, partial [Deltaproteobacteria bacterium]
MQPLATAKKVLARARLIPPERFLAALGRRGFAVARERASDLAERLAGDGLAWAVPGAGNDVDAISRIEGALGELPLPSAALGAALE